MWKYFVICSYLNSRVENWPLHSKILQWKQRYKKATKDLDWVVHSTLRYTTLLWKNLRISVLDFSFKSDWFDSETLPEIFTFTLKRQRQRAINSSFYFFSQYCRSFTVLNYFYNNIQLQLQPWVTQLRIWELLAASYSYTIQIQSKRLKV